MKIKDLSWSKMNNHVRIVNTLVNALSDDGEWSHRFREKLKLPKCTREDAWNQDISIFSHITDKQFLRFPNFGSKSLDELRGILPAPIEEKGPKRCPFCKRDYNEKETMQ
jgi:hypothetical protein